MSLKTITKRLLGLTFVISILLLSLFLSYSKPEKALATETCSAAPANVSLSTGGSGFDLTFNSTSGFNVFYPYNFDVFDSGRSLGSGQITATNDIKSFNNLTMGEHHITVDLIDINNCRFTPISDRVVNIEANGPVGITSITANPSALRPGETSTITVVTSNVLDNYVAHLYITDCQGEAHDKGPLSRSGDTYSYTWNTETAETETTCTSHQVSVKIFKADGSLIYGPSYITVYVNADGTNPDTGDTGGGSACTVGGRGTPDSTFLGRIRLSNLFKVLPTCNGTADPTQADLEDLLRFVENIINWAIDIASILAFIMIVYSGILYLIAYGDENKAGTAKKTLLWTFAGITLIMLCKVVIWIIYKILAPTQ